MNAREEGMLHAYHDRELGSFRRRRFERLLARSPELRRELEVLQLAGRLVREVDAEAAVPDLWDAIAGRLPAVGAESAREAPGTRERGPERWRWSWSLGEAWARPAAAAAAVVAAVAAGLLVWPAGTPPPGGSIRWLDAGNRSIMVVEDDADATIIWLLDSPSEGAQRRAERRSV